jgi:hypothetical protein
MHEIDIISIVVHFIYFLSVSLTVLFTNYLLKSLRRSLFVCRSQNVLDLQIGNFQHINITIPVIINPTLIKPVAIAAASYGGTEIKKGNTYYNF